VILVRHGERAALANDNDPPLTMAGEARARALAQTLEGTRVDAVLVTERQRTQMTARPLVQARGLTPQVVSLQSGPAHVDSVAAAVRRHAGRTVLVVGHSNTVPGIIRALSGLQLADLCDGEYANLYVLVLRPGAQPRLERRTYGEPDVPGASVCR
jgi:broad specificity phosphatase PhoE